MTPPLEDIWRDFAGKVHGFIRSRVRDQAAADDVLQEVFLKIHRGLPALRADQKLEPWVWRVTRNAVHDHFRRSRSFEEIEAVSLAAPEAGPELPDLGPCVRRFVRALDSPYREALILTEWQTLTQEQMARKLGISIPGAKSRVQRARAQLKRMLMNCCQLELDRRGTVVDMQPKPKQPQTACCP